MGFLEPSIFHVIVTGGEAEEGGHLCHAIEGSTHPRQPPLRIASVGSVRKARSKDLSGHDNPAFASDACDGAAPAYALDLEDAAIRR
jgi:hypothetical protein